MEINFEELRQIEDLNKRKLKYDLMVANNFGKNIIELNRIINEKGHMNVELKPIGIYLNNKIIELYHYFENSNISYSESSVNWGIINYFFLLTAQAHDVLVEYFIFNNTKINLLKRLAGKKVGNEYLKKYNDICDKILNFSINEDVLTAINFSLDDYMKQPYYEGNVNASISRVNDELNQIGINKKVEYREENISTPSVSIAEKLELYLKIKDEIMKDDERIKMGVQEILDESSEFLSPDVYDEIKSLKDDYINSEPKSRK